MPTRESSLHFLEDISSVRNVLREIRSRFFDLGAKRMSYHLVPPLNNPLNRDVVIVHTGFDDNAMGLYEDVRFRQLDPIAEEVLRTRKMMTWQQALAGKKLSAPQIQFIRTVRQFDMIDGFSIPLFGPHGRNGYCTVCLNRQLDAADHQLGLKFQDLAMAGHRRICDIILSRERSKYALSKRETDVLQWICRGKSNSEIATICGITSATVDTYVRRIFQKFGARSRIGVTVGALSLGVVKL